MRASGLTELRLREGRGLGMEKKLCFHLLYLLNNYYVPGTDSFGFYIGVSSFLLTFCIVASSMNSHHRKLIVENTGVWVCFPNLAKGACGGE